MKTLLAALSMWVVGTILWFITDIKEDPGLVMAIAWWIPMAIQAGIGVINNAGQQKRAAEQNRYRKEVIRHSPWTNMQDPGYTDSPTLLEGAAKGGASGLMMSGMLGDNVDWGSLASKGAGEGAAASVASDAAVQASGAGASGKMLAQHRPSWSAVKPDLPKEMSAQLALEQEMRDKKAMDFWRKKYSGNFGY